jgi:hypothetical protein
MAFPASWAIAQWLGRGWSCQPTRVRTLGFAPKKKIPSPTSYPKHRWARPWSLVPPCAWIAHSHVMRARVRMRWGYGGFLGLCEKGLLSLVKMPWGRSFPPQVEFFSSWATGPCEGFPLQLRAARSLFNRAQLEGLLFEA